MNSLQGHLLVATSELLDPNFRKTVVLIVRHDCDEGSLGLVLSRRTSTTIKELWQRITDEPCHRNDTLSLGGPCEGPLMALHTEAALDDIEVMPGLFFTADGDHLKHLVAEHSREVRFFYGYAGWGAGQLEMEIENGAWRVGLAAAKHVFYLDQELWDRTTAEAAGWEVLSALNIKEVRCDPSLN